MMSLQKYSLIQARRDLPTRSTRANKTHGGKCLILAGSRGMWGAAILTASAAARAGAGYVYIASAKPPPISRHPDFLFRTDFRATEILRYTNQYQSLAIGPGLREPKFILNCIKNLNRIKFKNVVLDAEALNVFKDGKNLSLINHNWILTPHEGELSRLLGVSAKTIRNNRRKYVELAQKKFGGTVILKGHRTLVATSSRGRQKTYEIQSGNSALAKAGTGDVLTGIIAGLLSQGLESVKAACLGAFIHGRIADDWIKSNKDHLSLLASDLIQQMPSTIFKIRK